MFDYKMRSKRRLRHNTTIDEVGDASAFLLSNLARGITGEIFYGTAALILPLWVT